MKKDEIITLASASGITVIAGLILNYIFLPAWNIHAVEMWIFILFLLAVFLGVVILRLYMRKITTKPSRVEKNMQNAPIAIAAVIVVFMVFAALFGSEIFNAKRYASIIAEDITEMNWEETVENKETVTDIALMDTNTASVFGNRTLGSLSDIVSQYDVSGAYTQVNLNGKPMKISLLEYESFWKWLSNKDKGIPGYVLVDPVNSTAKYVKLEEAVKYSPSEYFGRNLFRTLRRQYPAEMFGEIYFEVDESGHPYYVAPVYKTTISVFSGRKIYGAVILDAVTGEAQKLNTEDIPDWVDVVYDGNYLTERLDWWGEYSNGFWNSVFAKTGCRQTTKDGYDGTADYGYITIENDIWIYTGITSMAQDSSNIAVIMANERTGEIRYFAVAGADENSAMAAAEGEVQQYGYHASFPSLINVNGEPTYIMVLCDDNFIVKEYAMVNMDNYSKVVVESSQAKVFAAYAEEMGFEVPDKVEEELDNEENGGQEEAVLKDITFVVSEIQFIVNGGNTTVYITDENGKYYKSAFDEFWIVAKEGQKISAKYNEKYEGEAIISLASFKTAE